MRETFGSRLWDSFVEFHFARYAVIRKSIKLVNFVISAGGISVEPEKVIGGVVDLDLLS